MNIRTVGCLAAATFLCVWFAKAQPQAAGAPPPASLDAGRKLFVAKCGSCHNETGDKPLDKGLPLNQRTLTDAVIVENIEMRFKKATEGERRSVVAYMRSFMKTPQK